MTKINWRYTFGEILIVMVGISLAFTLNNLKDYYKNQEIEYQYLVALKSDIEDEIKHIEQLDSIMNLKVKSIRQSRPHFGRKLPGRDTIISKIFFVAKNVNFSPKNITYQTLINSGDMNLISNFELRKSIEEHYSLHKTISKNFDRLDNIYRTYLGDFFIRELDFGKIRTGNFDFVDNSLFASIFNSLDGSYQFALEANQTCLKSSKQLLDKIQTKINKKN